MKQPLNSKRVLTIHPLQRLRNCESWIRTWPSAGLIFSEAVAMALADRMGTREAIRRLRGEADLSSAKVVRLADVDSAGFYREMITSL